MQTIAVVSGKGGVGKSTIAAHIALAYHQQGMRVGLLDVDLYGPSIPTLFGLEQHRHTVNENQQIVPIQACGLQLVSFGFILGELPAIMRGPMIARYTSQLLNDVAWNDPDILILDLPPGTGDIHLTVTQTLALSGAIVVTTPHALSYADVGKAILMLNKVEVPVIGLIMNMHHVVCANCGSHQLLFGSDTEQLLLSRFGIPLLGTIPLDHANFGTTIGTTTHNTMPPSSTVQPPNPVLSPQPSSRHHSVSSFDSSSPANTAPHSNSTQPFPPRTIPPPEIVKITTHIIPLLKQYHAVPTPSIVNNKRHIVISYNKQQQQTISAYALRKACRCALCFDEYTNQPKKTATPPTDVYALEIKPVGNYALYIKWSDGHATGFFPFRYIKTLPQAKDINVV